jgi:hypothetical protein
MLNPVITAPGAAAYDLDAVKTHLRIVGSGDDASLNVIAQAASETLRAYLGCAFTTTTFLWHQDSFSQGRLATDDFWFTDRPQGDRRPVYMTLPMGPLASVSSVKYKDQNGALQTVSPSVYQIDTVHGRIAPIFGEPWPTIGAGYFSAVQIEFVAGFGATFTSMPARLTLGLYMLIGHWFENREAVQTFTLRDVPLGVFNLIDEFKR